MNFDAAAAVRRAMHLANTVGSAWARDELMENPRTFKAPAAEQALREYLEQAFAEALAAGVRVDAPIEELALLRRDIERLPKSPGKENALRHMAELERAIARGVVVDRGGEQ